VTSWSSFPSLSRTSRTGCPTGNCIERGEKLHSFTCRRTSARLAVTG
jgi:hypothetical protein